MYKEKQTRIVAIVVISLLVLSALYYFLPAKTFRAHKQKEITKEKIDSLREMLPKEMFQFLFNNDSLIICLNSMADFYYDSKDSTVYDTINKGSYSEYEFEWNAKAADWRLLSRYYFREDSTGLFSVAVHEEYRAYNDTWKQTSCDSFFNDIEGNFIMEKSSNGYIEKYDRYEDDTVKIVIHIMSHYSDTKTKETKDKKTGKIIKRQEFSRNSSSEEWKLKSEETYTYTGNITHTKTFTKDYGENELKYTGHDIESKVNDSLLINKGYSVDSLGIETLTYSYIHIKRKDKGKFIKSIYFSKENKIIREDIDSSYYDFEGNCYRYSKSAVYASRDGMISNSISDSLGRIKYFKSYHWNKDSSRFNTYERFGYYTPKSNISVRYEIKPSENEMMRTMESIDIDLLIDPYNSCKAALYWDDDDECFNVHYIHLQKRDKHGKRIETIEIE